MAEIFGPEMNFLEQLADDLQSTFLVIAYAGYEKNRKYIRERQADLEREYGPFLEHVDSDAGTLRTIPAYEILQDLLKGRPSHEVIRERCKEALGYLLLEPEEWLENYDGVFEEFYAED
ncbi:MAG: hypothetical protein MUP55_02975 [Candidatus Aenigmarchaeota archaeon]|nr:hypothetical protein [Candidatus Aenigmarchaeota archaeon]